jgi:hypothetical protein
MNIKTKRIKGSTIYTDATGDKLAVTCTRADGRLFEGVVYKLEELKKAYEKMQEAIAEKRLYVSDTDGTLIQGVIADSSEMAAAVINGMDETEQTSYTVREYNGEDISSFVEETGRGLYRHWDVSGGVFNPYLYKENRESVREHLTKILNENIDAIRRYTGYARPLYMKASWERD